MSRTRDVFMTVMIDVKNLCRFRNTQHMQRGVWDAQVPDDVKHRFIEQDFVKITPHVVYLTESGLEVLGYREATA